MVRSWSWLHWRFSRRLRWRLRRIRRHPTATSRIADWLAFTLIRIFPGQMHLPGTVVPYHPFDPFCLDPAVSILRTISILQIVFVPALDPLILLFGPARSLVLVLVLGHRHPWRELRIVNVVDYAIVGQRGDDRTQ